jgi:hypothetical protein
MRKYNIKEKHGKPYHPQTQGSIEKAHGPLKAWLTKVLLEYHKGKLPNDLVKCNGILNRLIAAKNHEVHYTTNAIPFTVNHFLNIFISNLLFSCSTKRLISSSKFQR